MKKTLIILVLINLWIKSEAQNCIEFQQHLKSIDSTFHLGHPIDNPDSIHNSNRAFVDYAIQNLLEKPTHRCFISNRSLLRQLDISFCDKQKVIIRDSLKTGEVCEIIMETTRFNPDLHKIKADEDTSLIESIDNLYPYGGEYGVPYREINKLKIKINNQSLSIPKSSYCNLFDPILCENHGFIRQVEAFESLDGKYIYLYIYGGNAAGTYFSKLVFDKKRFITRIISGYESLSQHGSFREDFIGF